MVKFVLVVCLCFAYLIIYFINVFVYIYFINFLLGEICVCIFCFLCVSMQLLFVLLTPKIFPSTDFHCVFLLTTVFLSSFVDVLCNVLPEDNKICYKFGSTFKRESERLHCLFIVNEGSLKNTVKI